MSHVSQFAGKEWDAIQYARFARYRRRPALDLIGAIPMEAPKVIYDLGCGTGKVTALLAEQWPAARISGIDKSEQMLDRARDLDTHVSWKSADIRDWQPEAPADLIFANASLHWLPDHENLFPHLVSLLGPGGCLAVQMPLSWQLPSHQLMRQTLQEARPAPLGSTELQEAMATTWVAEPLAYYDWLSGLAEEISIWSTTYFHPLEGENPIFEWVKGAGLRPILKGLTDTELADFLPAYKTALRNAYPRRADGKTIYPFSRMFMVICR